MELKRIFFFFFRIFFFSSSDQNGPWLLVGHFTLPTLLYLGFARTKISKFAINIIHISVTEIPRQAVLTINQMVLDSKSLRGLRRPYPEEVETIDYLVQLAIGNWQPCGKVAGLPCRLQPHAA